MTDTIDDGGLVYPSHESLGLTLRQWYAGQALANGDIWRAYRVASPDVARVCFKLADALIAHEKAERDGAD